MHKDCLRNIHVQRHKFQCLVFESPVSNDIFFFVFAAKTSILT